MKTKRPISEEDAMVKFSLTEQYQNDLDAFMEGEGYKWCREEAEYIDDGSEADMAAEQAYELKAGK